MVETENKNEKKTKEVSKQDKNFYTFISALIAAVLIFTFSVLFVATSDKEYSDNENRYLAQKPKLSFSSVKDGKFMEDTDAYISDQFAFRDKLVKTRTKIDIFLGKRDINGVYFGRRHFLFEMPAAYNEERITKTTDTMNKLKAKNKDINNYIVIVPNSGEIISKYMPLNAPAESQEEQINKIYSKLDGFNCIDVCKQLKAYKEPQELYYKTDHHWTATGADIGYNTIAKSLNINTKAYKHKNLAVTNSFQGALASSSGIFSAKDTIYIPAVTPEVPYAVNYINEKKMTATVYDSSKLNEKSKYEVFFGGNFPQIVIETNAKTDRVLLVIKDSYANAIMPMLIPHFSTIVMVDPRYYTDNIQDTMDKNGVTDILWLYGANTFLNDTSITEKFN